MISGSEIIFIIFVAIMVFGADKIPGIARGLGKTMRQLRDATESIKNEIQKSAQEATDKEVIKEIEAEVEKAKEQAQDAANSIKREL